MGHRGHKLTARVDPLGTRASTEPHHGDALRGQAQTGPPSREGVIRAGARHAHPALAAQRAGKARRRHKGGRRDVAAKNIMRHAAGT